MDSEFIFSAEDRTVPFDEIHSFIDGLKVRRARLELEMSKFDFVERNDGDSSGIDAHLQLPRRDTPGANAEQPKAAKGKRLPRAKGRRKSSRAR